MLTHLTVGVSIHKMTSLSVILEKQRNIKAMPVVRRYSGQYFCRAFFFIMTPVRLPAERRRQTFKSDCLCVFWHAYGFIGFPFSAKAFS